MSKELTPLQALDEIKTIKNLTISDRLLEPIETALKDYESRKVFLDNVDNNVLVFEPKEVWEEKQKKLKALELVKPFLSANDFLYLCRIGANNVTQEEYELLQEVLK